MNNAEILSEFVEQTIGVGVFFLIYIYVCVYLLEMLLYFQQEGEKKREKKKEKQSPWGIIFEYVWLGVKI